MPKKKIIISVDSAEEESASTAVAIITPEFEALPVFKLEKLDDLLDIIQDKANEYGALTIEGVEDTAGFKKVVAARGEIKKTRTTWVKAAYDNFIDPLKKNLKEFEGDIAKVEAALKAIEAPLQEKETFIKNEKIRLAAEEELRKTQVFQSRVVDLLNLGAGFDGQVYTFSYDQALLVTAGQLKDWSDDEYNGFKEDVQDSYDKEQERINNQLAADELEKERLRLQAIKDKELIDAANEKVRKVREKELIRVLGYSFSEVDGEYSHPDIPIPVRPEILAESDDVAWEALVYCIENYVAVVEPEAAPVVEEPKQDTSAFSGPGSAGSAFVVRHFSEFESPQEEEEQTLLVEPEEIEFAEVLMSFNQEHPFTDVDISPKMFQRFYPEEYADKAMAGIEKIANEGKVQGLCWMIMVKGS